MRDRLPATTLAIVAAFLLTASLWSSLAGPPLDPGIPNAVKEGPPPPSSASPLTTGNITVTLGGGGLSDVVVGWDLPGDLTGVLNYAVYAGDAYDPGGAGYELLGEVPANGRSFTHNAAGKGNANTFYYQVRTNSSTASAGQVVQGAKIGRILATGSSMAALPLIPNDPSVEAVLQSVLPDIRSVRAYDSTDAADPWKIFSPGRGGDLAELSVGTAFWLDVASGPASLAVTGIVPTSTSLSLSAGWNLITLPAAESMSMSSALAGLPYTAVEAFDPTQAPYSLRGLGAQDILEPAVGFWVQLSTAASWTVSFGSPPDMTPGIEHSMRYKDQDILYYVPLVHQIRPEETRVFFVIHGASRTYQSHFDRWMEANVTELYNVVLVTPHFDVVAFDEYQRLNVGGERADLRLIELFEKFTEWLTLKPATFLLYGFSGGGQFAHRFVLAHPGYVERAVAGGSGTYTFPDIGIDFPHGLNLSQYEPIDLVFDLQTAYLANMSIMVGLNDTLRTPDLSQTPESDAQGANRLERARNFMNATASYAGVNGWALNYSYQEVPDADHSSSPLMPYAIPYLFE